MLCFRWANLGCHGRAALWSFERKLNVLLKSLDLPAVLISCCCCNKFSGWKQFKLSYSLGGLKSKLGWQDGLPSGGSQGGSISLLLKFLGVTCIPWFMIPSVHHSDPLMLSSYCHLSGCDPPVRLPWVHTYNPGQFPSPQIHNLITLHSPFCHSK